MARGTGWKKVHLEHARATNRQTGSFVQEGGEFDEDQVKPIRAGQTITVEGMGHRQDTKIVSLNQYVVMCVMPALKVCVGKVLHDSVCNG